MQWSTRWAVILAVLTFSSHFIQSQCATVPLFPQPLSSCQKFKRALCAHYHQPNATLLHPFATSTRMMAVLNRSSHPEVSIPRAHLSLKHRPLNNHQRLAAAEVSAQEASHSSSWCALIDVLPAEVKAPKMTFLHTINWTWLQISVTLDYSISPSWLNCSRYIFTYLCRVIMRQCGSLLGAPCPSMCPHAMESD